MKVTKASRRVTTPTYVTKDVDIRDRERELKARSNVTLWDATVGYHYTVEVVVPRPQGEATAPIAYLDVSWANVTNPNADRGSSDPIPVSVARLNDLIDELTRLSHDITAMASGIVDTPWSA